MKTVFKILFLFLICTSMAFSQSVTWTKEELDRANTGVKASYMSQTEKQVLFILNLARINPKKFAATYLKNYTDSLKKTNNPSVKSLHSTLMKTQVLPAFVPQQDLFDMAQQHAVSMGKAGKIGHDDFMKRSEKQRARYSGLGENCDYGFNNPLTIAMRFLIDEGVKDLGHRKNVLSAEYLFIGVALRPHKKHNYNCVVEFAGKEK